MCITYYPVIELKLYILQVLVWKLKYCQSFSFFFFHHPEDLVLLSNLKNILQHVTLAHTLPIPAPTWVTTLYSIQILGKSFPQVSTGPPVQFPPAAAQVLHLPPSPHHWVAGSRSTDSLKILLWCLGGLGITDLVIQVILPFCILVVWGIGDYFH